MSLRPCVSCTRHVRSSEAVCPFCGETMSVAPAIVPRRVTGLGRAAIMAFGVTAAGCETPAPAYGGPPVDAAMSPDGGGAVDDAGFAPAYGTPAFDSGTDAGLAAMYGGPSFDAGPDGGGSQVDTGGGIGPLYGGSP